MLLHNEEVQSILEDVKHADNIGVPCVHQHFELVHKQIVKSRLLAEQVLFEDLERQNSLFAFIINRASIFCLHLGDLFITQPAVVDVTERSRTYLLALVILFTEVSDFLFDDRFYLFDFCHTVLRLDIVEIDSWHFLFLNDTYS